MAEHPKTPDGRYFVVRGRLWRCSNPERPEARRSQLVNELMDAGRAVKQAKVADESGQLQHARQRVDEAKVSLGERGPVWWHDGSQDFNRYLVISTPYCRWFEQLKQEQDGERPKKP
ncbi:hypothetical protein PPUN110474_09910 [Pseudomonas putida]|nr:hypothetical protein PPUN110474_09910 [Pseudomonas putida]